VRQLPDGVYLTTMRQVNDTVTLTGVAQSNERVSELLRNLSSGSAWITRPELIEIVAGNVALTPKDQRRVSNFSMRFKLQKASVAQKAMAASAASAAAPAAPVAARPASGALAVAAPASAATAKK
jgi:type IV pilus assembly protein PilN